MEWKEDIAAVFCSSVTDGTHDSPKTTIKGRKLITSKHLKEGYIDFESAKLISEKDYLKVIERSKVDQFDILFSMIGTIGNIYRETSPNIEYAVKNMGIFKMGGNAVRSKWLFYWLKSKEAKAYIHERMAGSTQSYLTLDSLRKFPVVYPEDINDMENIVSILSSLDRKIELNNKINADLEEMAQAIFKNWFVDFEPFKNGKFVDSELGMIPEGWKVGSYSEMIESLISGDWGKDNPQGNYTHEVACVRGCDFQDINNGVRGKTPQRYILEKNYQAKHLKDNDILVEISGGTATVSTGRTSLVTEELLKKYKHDIVCTNFCKVLRPLSQFSSYVYYSWKYKYDNDIMFGYENGTSGIKNFAIKDFIEKEPVLIPKEQDIVEFQKIIDNLQKQKQIKGTENTTLSTLRDTLLPRLMSGELEIPE